MILTKQPFDKPDDLRHTVEHSVESSEILELCRNGKFWQARSLQDESGLQSNLCTKYRDADEHRALTNVVTKTAPHAPHHMRSPELAKLHTQEEKPLQGSLNFSFLEVLKNPFGIFDQKVKLWSSKRYVEAAHFHQDNLSEKLPPIINELQTDLQSFFDEYAALLPRVKYEYGTSGMKNGYTQSMVQVAQHHLEEQELKNLPTERAMMEVSVAQAVESWMSTPDLPPGSKIVCISPRGSKQEGYPGQNKMNYIFVNVFEKKHDGFVLHQYRSYDTLDQSVQLQSLLVNEETGSLQYAAPLPQPRKDLHVIASLVKCSPEIALSDIESYIYAHKQSWAVDVESELPQLDWNNYAAVSRQAVELCLQQFTELTNDSAVSTQTEEHFTLLVTTIKESLIKWVETHALNYESKGARHQLEFDQVLSVWKARCSQVDGKKLDSEQKTLIDTFKNATALDASLPLKGLSSWAHCIVGSPTSLINLNNIEMMQALKGNHLSQAQITQLIGAERASLWHEGTCVRCSSTCLVGECSICMKCELELGGQLPADVLSNTKEQFLSSLSQQDRSKGKELFQEFSSLVLRKTVSFEQLINNDFVDPRATATDELEPYMNRILFAPNGLEELEKIVLELSTNIGKKEHKRSGVVFAMPTPAETPNTALAA